MIRTVLSTERHRDGRHFLVVTVLQAGGFAARVTSDGRGPYVVETDAPSRFALSAARTLGVRGAFVDVRRVRSAGGGGGEAMS